MSYPPQQPTTWYQSNQMPTQQVVRRGANHGLHLVITLLTFGLWIPGWIIAAIIGRKETIYGPPAVQYMQQAQIQYVPPQNLPQQPAQQQLQPVPPIPGTPPQ